MHTFRANRLGLAEPKTYGVIESRCGSSGRDLEKDQMGVEPPAEQPAHEGR